MRFDIITIFPGFFDGPVRLRDTEARAHDRAGRDCHARSAQLYARPPSDCGRPALWRRRRDGAEGSSRSSTRCIAAGLRRRLSDRRQKETVILLSAQGRPFTQAMAQELAAMERVVLLCGRYEGVDERVNELLCDREISIGDYVLSGGELAAAVIVDAVVRLLPGALGNPDSSRFESFGAEDDRGGCRRVLDGPPGRRMGRADCWTIRITRGRRSFGGCGFRRLCWAEIMRRFGGGGEGWL